MLRILKSKMLERNIDYKDIAKVIGSSTRAVRGKIAEKTPFTWPEVCMIRKIFFPDIDTDELLASD